jgi:hypothetical protein
MFFSLTSWFNVGLNPEIKQFFLRFVNGRLHNEDSEQYFRQYAKNRI